jgi:hypothetical protein
VCPSGPLLLSFWSADPVYDPEESASGPLASAPTRLERVVEGLLRKRLLGLAPVEPGTVWARGMFVHYVTRAELEDEASRSGWRLAHYERGGGVFPHAVLV